MDIPVNSSRVLVLGYGEMGHAMEVLLGRRCALTIWQRRPPHGSPVSLSASAEAGFVLFCLPAVAHAPVGEQLRPFLRTGTLCVTIAKGLDDAGRTPAEILSGLFGPAPVAVVYGPMISEDIRAGRPAFAQCSAADAVTADRVRALFEGTALHLQRSDDLIGLGWSAILKNVYAIAFGLADGLALGDNVRGGLAVVALHELAAIVRALGGQPATPYHFAGLGDLITTATSTGSHHREMGHRLARGDSALAGEGLHTLAALRAHPRFDGSRYPLFHLVDAMVQAPRGAATQFRDFLNRITDGPPSC